jgi:hypothetical protein
MKKSFVWGLLLGLFLGGAATATAVTSAGPLLGWTVLDEDGDEVCSDPYMHNNIKTIEC